MDDPDTSVGTMSDLAKSIDFTWMFVCVVLVVLMQAGFAAYEVTETRKRVMRLELRWACVHLGCGNFSRLCTCHFRAFKLKLQLDGCSRLLQ